MVIIVVWPAENEKKIYADDKIPSILEPVEDPDPSGDKSSKAFNKNWARLIQKIYEVDPLTCARCRGHHGYFIIHRGSGNHKKDPQPPGLMGRKALSASQSHRVAKDRRIQH